MSIGRYLCLFYVCILFAVITSSSYIHLECTRIREGVCVIEKEDIRANPGDIILPSREDHTSISFKRVTFDSTRCNSVEGCTVLFDLRKHDVEISSSVFHSSILHFHARALRIDKESKVGADGRAPTISEVPGNSGSRGGGGAHSGIGGLGCCYGKSGCDIFVGGTNDHILLPKFPGGHAYLRPEDTVPVAYGGGIVNITVARDARIDGVVSASGTVPETASFEMHGGSAGGTILIATGVGEFDDYDYDDDIDPEPEPEPEPEPDPDPDPNPNPDPKPDPEPEPKPPSSRLASLRVLHILHNLSTGYYMTQHVDALSQSRHPSNVVDATSLRSTILNTVDQESSSFEYGYSSIPPLSTHPPNIFDPQFLSQLDITEDGRIADPNTLETLLALFPPSIRTDVENNPILRGTPGTLSGEGSFIAVGGNGYNSGGGGGGGRVVFTQRDKTSSIKVEVHGGLSIKLMNVSPRDEFIAHAMRFPIDHMDTSVANEDITPHNTHRSTDDDDDGGDGNDHLQTQLKGSYCEGGGGGSFVEVGDGVMNYSLIARSESAPLVFTNKIYTEYPPYNLSASHCKLTLHASLLVLNDAVFDNISTTPFNAAIFSLSIAGTFGLSSSSTFATHTSIFNVGTLSIDQTSTILFKQSLSITTDALNANNAIAEEGVPTAPTTLKISSSSKIAFAPLLIRAGSIFIEGKLITGSNTGITATGTLIEHDCENEVPPFECEKLLELYAFDDESDPMISPPTTTTTTTTAFKRFHPTVHRSTTTYRHLESIIKSSFPLTANAHLHDIGTYHSLNDREIIFLEFGFNTRSTAPIYPTLLEGTKSTIVWKYLPSVVKSFPELQGNDKVSHYALTVAAAKVSMETQSSLKAHSVAVCAKDFTLMGNINTALQGCSSEYGRGSGGSSGLSGGGAGYHTHGGRSFLDRATGVQSSGGDPYFQLPPLHRGSSGGSPRSDVGSPGPGGGLIHITVTSIFNGSAASFLSDGGPPGQRGGGGSGGSITLHVCDFRLSKDTVFSSRGGDGNNGSGGGSGGVFYIRYIPQEPGTTRKCVGNLDDVVPHLQLEGGKGGELITKHQRLPSRISSLDDEYNNADVVFTFDNTTAFDLFDRGDDNDDDYDITTQGAPGGSGGFYSLPECSPGSAGFSCSQCKPGTASSTSDGALECKPCEYGRYATNPGSVTCSLCPKGQYADVRGSTTCKKCPGGKHAKFEGSTECTSCVPGRYSKEGQAECTMCEVNQRSSAEATECTDCAPGTTSPRGSSSCFDCDPISPNAYFSGPGCGYKCNAGYVYPKCQTPLQRCIEMVGGVLNLFIIVLLLFLFLTIPLMLVWFIRRRATEEKEKHDVLSARKIYQLVEQQQQSPSHQQQQQQQQYYQNGSPTNTPPRQDSGSSLYNPNDQHNYNSLSTTTHATPLAPGIRSLNDPYAAPLLSDTDQHHHHVHYHIPGENHVHERISTSNMAHLKLSVFDIPNLLARVYLMGSNTPGRNLSLTVEVPPHLRGIVLEAPYRLFAIGVNKITQWTKAQRVTCALLKLLFYPLYAAYVQRIQFQIIEKLAVFITRHPRDFISDSRSRTLGDTLRLGFSADLTTFWIDFIDNTNIHNTHTTTAMAAGGFLAPGHVLKGPSLPLVVYCSGTGEFNYPYHVDLTDPLVKSVSCYFGHNWYSFLLTLNCFLRSIPYHGVYSPRYMDPVLNYLTMMNRVGGIGIGTHMQLSGMAVDIGVVYEPVVTSGDVGQLESIRLQDASPLSSGHGLLANHSLNASSGKGAPMWPRLVLIICAEPQRQLDHYPVAKYSEQPALAPPGSDSAATTTTTTGISPELAEQFDQSMRVQAPSQTAGSFDVGPRGVDGLHHLHSDLSTVDGLGDHHGGDTDGDGHAADVDSDDIFQQRSLPPAASRLNSVGSHPQQEQHQQQPLHHHQYTSDSGDDGDHIGTFTPLSQDSTSLMGQSFHSHLDIDYSDSQYYPQQQQQHTSDDSKSVDINFDDFDNGDDDLQNSSLIEAALGYNPHKIHTMMSPKHKKRAVATMPSGYPTAGSMHSTSRIQQQQQQQQQHQRTLSKNSSVMASVRPSSTTATPSGVSHTGEGGVVSSSEPSHHNQQQQQPHPQRRQFEFTDEANRGEDDHAYDDDHETTLPYGAQKLIPIDPDNAYQSRTGVLYSDSDDEHNSSTTHPRLVYRLSDKLSLLCLSNSLRNNHFTVTSVSFVVFLSFYLLVFALFNITYAQLAPFPTFLSTLLILPLYPIVLPCVGFLCIVTRSVRMAQVFTVINIGTFVSSLYKAIIVGYSYSHQDVDYVMLFMPPTLMLVSVVLFPISHQYIAHLSHKHDIELCRGDYLRDKFQLELTTANALDEPMKHVSDEEHTTSLHRSISTLSNASNLDVDITPRTPS